MELELEPSCSDTRAPALNYYRETPQSQSKNGKYTKSEKLIPQPLLSSFCLHLTHVFTFSFSKVHAGISEDLFRGIRILI